MLIAVSYYLTNIYWLRVTAVFGLALEIVYFSLSGGDMSAGIVWGVFAGFSDGQLARLVTSGAWRQLDPGTVLTHEGKEVTELVLICDGQAIVDVTGAIVASLRDGAFVGEMAFVSGKPASATSPQSSRFRTKKHQHTLLKPARAWPTLLPYNFAGQH